MKPSSTPFQQGSPGFCFRSPLQVPRGTLQNGYILPFGERKFPTEISSRSGISVRKACEDASLAGTELRSSSSPSVQTEQTQRYARTRELTQAYSVGAFSGLSHHTSLHTCGETGVSANRSHWVQLPEMFLGVCSRDGTQPNTLDYCHPWFPTPGKSPTAQNLRFPTWRNPRPAYGNDNCSYWCWWWGPQMVGIDPISIRWKLPWQRQCVLPTRHSPLQATNSSACILHMEPDIGKTPQNRNTETLFWPWTTAMAHRVSHGYCSILWLPSLPVPSADEQKQWRDARSLFPQKGWAGKASFCLHQNTHHFQIQFTEYFMYCPYQIWGHSLVGEEAWRIQKKEWSRAALGKLL